MDQLREILLAAELGDQERMRNYISSVGVNVFDEEGSTPLMYAAANGEEKIVRLLLQNGVDVDQQNHYGWTALLQASCYGHHEVVYTLLQNGASIDLFNNWGATPLVAAAQGGFMTVVQVLLEKGSAINTTEDVSSITPLMAAAQCGSEAIVSKLLYHGSNVNTRLQSTGWTALMLASLNNHIPVITQLLRHGAVREMRDVNNKRAIDLASALGLSDVVSILSEELLESPSSDIDIFDAVKQENVDMLLEALKKHKVSATVIDKDGATPLMYAARKGNMKLCQLLLDSGADVDAQDHIHQWTAFMHAAHHKHHEVARLLAHYGANVNLRAQNGSSAFDIANLIGDSSIIQLIAQVTIQRLTQKEDKTITLMTVKEEEEITLDREESPQVLSPIGSDKEDDDDVSTEAIKRRLSNAYLASGTPSIKPDAKGFLHPRKHSPFLRSPSPEQPEQGDTILPAVTKHFSPPHRKSPTSPRELSPPAPLSLQVPKRQQLEEIKEKFTKPHSPKPMHKKPVIPSFGIKPARKPGLNLAFPSKDQPSSVSGKFVPMSRNTPPIKSPRSLPSNPFNFINSPVNHKGAPSFKKGEAVSLSKGRFPPNISSTMGKQKMKVLEKRSTDIRFGDKGQRSQFNYDPLTKTPSFDKLKLKPATHRGLDLKTVLHNVSLGKYYSLFEEEEMDIHSFLTLTESDLIDVGVAVSQDRRQMLTLIAQLKDTQHLRSPKSPKPGSSFKFH